MRAFILILFLAIAAAAPPQEVPRTVEIRLSSFDFTPSTIRLAAGRPVVLHLVNTGGGGHNFAAPEFFAAATGVQGPVQRGRVEVAGRQSVDIRLTPARGTYRLRCTHTLHTSFGMTGRIVVE
jgi:plastocyanin